MEHILHFCLLNTVSCAHSSPGSEMWPAKETLLFPFCEVRAQCGSISATLENRDLWWKHRACQW